MDTLELFLSFLGGGVVGALAGGWLARWTEREKPLRDQMIGVTTDFVDAVTAGIAVLASGDGEREPELRLAQAEEECSKALGALGRLHVLFHERTYQEAEETVAALRLGIGNGDLPAPRHVLEPVYRHLRAFADCAGAEIRRPAGVIRRYGAIGRLGDHIARQMGDDKPSSPLLDSLDKHIAPRMRDDRASSPRMGSIDPPQ